MDEGAIAATNKNYRLLFVSTCISHVLADYIASDPGDRIVTTSLQRECLDSEGAFVGGILSGTYSPKGDTSAATRLARFIEDNSPRSGKPKNLADIE